MNKEDIKNYFDLYVLNYQPYKDIPEYQSIVKTLIEFYFDHSYNQINLPFIQAFEQQFIPIEFYENLLLSIGFPKKIISILTQTDKKILLHSFMDYNRYKGTIEQIRDVGEKFSEDVGIYELFIDLKEVKLSLYNLHLVYDQNYFDLDDINFYNQLKINDIILIDSIGYSINSKIIENGIFRIYINKQHVGDTSIITKFIVMRWVFIPEPIYIATNVTPLKEYFDYEEIYNETKQYFVSTEHLTARYENEGLVLPIKSNLLFLDYRKYREINTFYNLLAAIFLKEYYDERLIVYFKDGEYSITLGRLYKLWYYVLMKFYNYDYVDNSPLSCISLDINNANFTYTINDIPELFKEYIVLNYTYEDLTDKLKERITQTEYISLSKTIKRNTDYYSKFYFKYFTNKLFSEDDIQQNITLEEYEIIIENEVGIDLINYINSRVDNSKSELKSYEYNFILNEIYNSIITWSIFSQNPKILNNIDYFLKNLSFITYPISMSPTYNLILFLKPYHVELIKEISEYLKIKDIGNSAIPDSETLQKMMLSFLKASTLAISDDIMNTIIYNNNNINADSTLVTHGRIYNINQLVNTLQIVQSDLYNFIIYYIRESVIEPESNHFIFNLYSIIKSLVFVISNGFYEINLINKEDSFDLLNNYNLLLTEMSKLNILCNTSRNELIIELIDFDGSAYLFNSMDMECSIHNLNVNTKLVKSLLYSITLTSPLTTNNIISHSYNLI